MFVNFISLHFLISQLSCFLPRWSWMHEKLKLYILAFLFQQGIPWRRGSRYNNFLNNINLHFLCHPFVQITALSSTSFSPIICFFEPLTLFGSYNDQMQTPPYLEIYMKIDFAFGIAQCMFFEIVQFVIFDLYSWLIFYLFSVI